MEKNNRMMDERELSRRLKRKIFVCVLIGCVILAAGMVMLIHMSDSLNDMIAEQMKTETNECKRRILRQIDKDYQNLNTLAAFLAECDLKNGTEFKEVLAESNRGNDFITMAYFDAEGMGIMVNEIYGVWDQADYHMLKKEVQNAIEDAYQGRQGISKLFQSKVDKDRVVVYTVPVKDLEGKVIGVLAASNNIEIFENLFEGDTVVDGNGEMHILNSEGKVIASSDECSSQNKEDLFHSAYFSSADQKRIEEEKENEEGVFANIKYNKKEFYTYISPVGINGWYMMCVTNHRGANQVAYQMANTMGVTFILLIVVITLLLLRICRMLIQNNQSLMCLAYTDRLTGADNVSRFKIKLAKAREEIDAFSIAAVNVRQFKFVNEIFGTKKADQLLIKIKKMTEEMLAEGEFFCRESADTFYLFLGQTDQQVLETRLTDLMERITGETISESADYQVTMYTGVTVYEAAKDGGEISNEMLLTQSRFAMQYSKGFSGNHVHFYDASIHKNEEMDNYIETHMHQALEKGEFRFFLQPKMDLKTGKLGGAEALVRWITESGDMIFPDAFIPQFERNGFCVKLDMYMVEKACAKIRSWIDQGLEPIPISVNQSKLLFFEAGYIPTLEALIEKYQIKPEMITLEILEGLALEHASETNAKLKQLHEIGFCISMDDFGSGYASFNTLGKLQIDELKLDRSFLLETTKSENGRFRQIMEHIVNLAKSLQISTVVEGVETEENEELIRSLGCDFGQGYLYSRPINEEEFDHKYMETA